MPSLRGYTAYILNALTNTPLEEHRPTVNEAGTLATCYIESDADQPFSIVLRDTIGLTTQGTAVFVDGVYVDNGLTGPGIAAERSWFGKRIDHITVKPFIFRHNPSVATFVGESTLVGTIRLSLRRCQISGVAQDQTNRGAVPQDTDPPDVRNIHSQDDYLAHRAEYCAPMEIPATLYHVSWVDEQHQAPFLEFRFIYRSREVLQSKGLLTPDKKALELFQAITQIQPEAESQGKKRKAKSEPKPRKNAKKRMEEASPSARMTNKEELKPRPKPEVVSPKEDALATNSPMERDVFLSDRIEHMDRRKLEYHTPSPRRIPSITMSPPTDESHLGILRELRELREEVKFLRQTGGYNTSVPQIASPGTGAPHSFGGHGQTQWGAGAAGSGEELWGQGSQNDETTKQSP